MQLHPQGIQGLWKSGIILDWHTIDSVCVGENEFGHPIFETTRSEIGELLYRAKYHNDSAALKKLLSESCKCLAKAKGKFDIVAPIPPSKPGRNTTAQIAQGLAECLGGIYGGNAIGWKRRPEQEIKSVQEPEKRKVLLENALIASPDMLNGKIILLTDDLFRSGATLEAATKAAYEQGHASEVYVFAVTRTRRNR